MASYTEYKKRVQEYGLTKFKEKVRAIVLQKNLSSVMNDTKWLELQKDIESLRFPPPFDAKYITDPDDYTFTPLEDAPWWVGDWSSFWEEGLPPFFNIEWVKVRPRHGIYRGCLVGDEVLDITDEFVSILKKHSIPYEEKNGTFTIYGYR